MTYPILMKRLFAARDFLVYLILAVFCVLAGIYLLDVWQGSQLSAVPDHDYTSEINELRHHGKVGEALAICNYVKSQPGMPNRDAIMAIGQEIEREQASWLGKAKRFGGGFVTGSMDSSEAAAGTVISDFLIIGDIRDLGNQGYNAATGQEVDKMVAVLSGIGVITSAAALIPEPGEPAIAAADAGMSLMKCLKKINAVTAEFAKEVVELGKGVLQSKKLGRLGIVLQDLGSLAHAAPAGTLGTAMKEVKSADELKAMARCLEMAPNEAITALHVGGGKAKDWMITTPGMSRKILGNSLRKGAAALASSRRYIRGMKFIFRGRLDELRNRAIDWVLEHPQTRMLFLVLGGSCLALAIVFAISCMIRARRIFHPHAAQC